MDNKMIDKLKSIIISAGDILKSSNVIINKHKSINDLLTMNDIIIENYIIDNIKKEYPNINIISEENNPNNKLDGYTIVIDPIDGTCNFASDIGLYGIQLALFDNMDCIFSSIYFPLNNELIYAIKNQGCYCNDVKLVVSNKDSIDGILLISDYYSNISISIDKQFELVKNLQKNFLKTRHFGAACVDFSFMAKSNGVAYISYYSNIWDIAPGLLIAKEAGCVYKNIYGKDYQYNDCGIVVANNINNLNLILNIAKEII